MHSTCIRKHDVCFRADEITFNNIYAFNVHKKDDVCFRVSYNYDDIALNNIYPFNVHKKDDFCFRVVHNY